MENGCELAVPVWILRIYAEGQVMAIIKNNLIHIHKNSALTLCCLDLFELVCSVNKARLFSVTSNPLLDPIAVKPV